MELFDTHFVKFGQVLAVSGMKLLVKSNWYVQVVKSQPYQDNFQNTHAKMKTNIRLWMYTPNGTVWYPFCPVWSSISYFRGEIVSVSNRYLQVVKLITTVPRLLSEHSFQNEKKHQIMNVHTKWNCLIPILSSLVKY